ncbi:hypothetical protein Leryth_018988 [Lithospermum erythrorhizon]|nr:hypothetical protein Leryth_018988 [Lithospermum erythrorhizon]
MGSLSVEVSRKKTMWMYPKVVGAQPSERWGHSACYFNGLVYIFGGCCGGLHFSDVIVLNRETMSWNTLVTTGCEPGPRDSHSAVLVGHRMIIFGGTNGSKKVNDLHVLDMKSLRWSKPVFDGIPPSPRESHTATLVGSDKFVIFGGSGEGERNYLNDVHVLDLKSMSWISTEVRGDKPVPRDSHSAVAVGNKLFVYGGDCGDRYLGNVDVLDMESLTWSKPDIIGPSPGIRAGHTSVNFGAKVFIIGGVGDKQYYNDVWVLDVANYSWIQLDVNGSAPHGRFSHAATSTGLDIIIYGGCGEDERPLNELLILQLVSEHLNSPPNISPCKFFGNHCNMENRMTAGPMEDNLKGIYKGRVEDLDLNESREYVFRNQQPPHFTSDSLHPKRQRTSNAKINEDLALDVEEHSLSLSQHSSPSQSDHEQTPFNKAKDSVILSPVPPIFKQQIQSQRKFQPKDFLKEHHNIKHVPLGTQQEQYGHVHRGRCEETWPSQYKSAETGKFQPLIGAEVHGKVDGLFDSGLLMTATVNGRIYRGVLFAPGPSVVSRGTIVSQHQQPLPSQAVVNNVNHSSQYQLPISKLVSEQCRTPPGPVQGFQQIQTCRPNLGNRRPSANGDSKIKSELEGVVLTLRGPGYGDQMSM